MTEWYDAERLFREADARQLVKSMWARQDFRMAGSTLFCRCPSGHKETRLDHCAVYKSGCKCFSCGEHFSAKEMVERYFGDATFAEVCGRIADCLGGREFYLITKNKKKVKTLPLTREELEIIGIYSPEGNDGPKISELYKNNRDQTKKWLLSRAKEFLERYEKLLSSEKNSDLSAELERRKKVTETIVKRLG